MAHKLTVAIDVDELSNPCEDYGSWTFVSFSRKWSSYQDREEFFNRSYSGIPYPKIGIASKLRAGTAFILDCYAHSDVTWSLAGQGYNCPWDTSHCAGILLWNNPTAEMGAKTYQDRKADAGRFLEVWNDYVNGFGFWYSIDKADGDFIDSCGGFYNFDRDSMLKDNIYPAIKSYMEEIGITKVCDYSKLDDDSDMEENLLYIEIESDMDFDFWDVYEKWQKAEVKQQ